MHYQANGARFIAADDMIVWWLLQEKGRAFEPETTAWLTDAIHAPGTFVDIGAGTGWFSIPFALRGCDVWSFEPHPGVADRLRDNLALNRTSAHVYRVALSDRDGEAVLHFNAGLSLTSGASIEPGGCLSPSGRATVQTVTLDSLDLRPQLIKIDVEGHEMAVLSGAEETIRRHRPHLVLEANTDRHRDGLIEWLVGHGYEWRRADDRNLLCSPSS